jgi:dienelactone hydrolase
MMFAKLYEKWMIAWETALTTRDSNRVERPLEWGFEFLADCGGVDAARRVEAGEISGLQAMEACNERIVADPRSFFAYDTPRDFRLEMRHPELYPTNVRPGTLAAEREYVRRAEVGELRREPFLRFTSAVRTPYAENDVVNARWYEAEDGAVVERHVDVPAGPRKDKPRKRRQAMIVMPQWNADAISHNVFGEIFTKFGVSVLRLSKPYHDVRRPQELERSDYAVSANVGRTIAACRQAVADVRSCVDWLESQGYEDIGVLGTSLGSCYAFIAAAMDKRLKVCAFNHASTWFGDVVWTGQSTRHVQAAFEHAGLTREDVRRMFAAISPSAYMKEFAASRNGMQPRQTLVIYAPYDLTFIHELSLDVLRSFDEHGIAYEAKVLPCGHYTTGEWPFKYIDGWYLGSFVWRAMKRLREQ